MVHSATFLSYRDMKKEDLELLRARKKVALYLQTVMRVSHLPPTNVSRQQVGRFYDPAARDWSYLDTHHREETQAKCLNNLSILNIPFQYY